jgi:hypothetical protein
MALTPPPDMLATAVAPDPFTFFGVVNVTEGGAV